VLPADFTLLQVVPELETGGAEQTTLDVARAVIDAGVAMGMTPRQLLWMVELPLALPSIVAGIRIATIVGIKVLVAVVTYVISQIVDAATGATTSMMDTSASGSGPVFTGAVLASAIISNVIAGLIKAGAKLFTDVLTITAYADMRARMEPLSTAALAAELGLAPATGSEWVSQEPPPPVAY